MRTRKRRCTFVGNSLQKSSVTGTAFFNENALEAQVPCTSTLQGEPGSQWLRLRTEDFRKFLANEPDKMLLGRLGVHSVTATVLAKGAPPSTSLCCPESRWNCSERRHWIVFLKKILLPLLFGIIVFGWGGTHTDRGGYAVCRSASVGVAAAEWLMDALGLGGLLQRLFLVTNMRVAQVEKVIFFSKETGHCLVGTGARCALSTEYLMAEPFGAMARFRCIPLAKAVKLRLFCTTPIRQRRGLIN